MNQAELWQLAGLLRQYVDEDAPADARNDFEQLRNVVLYQHHLREELAALSTPQPATE